MRHASLFSGIGGFDLAAHWMGWENVFNCDIEEFPRKVLKYHFPNAIQYEDIKRTDFTVHRGSIDILTGGFPCQPFSTAGKRLGKNDERHLWPEMFRAIREIRPRFIVGENVRGLLSWSDGLVLDEVYSDLEAEGYEVQAFVLPAAGLNAPHKRDRVWIIANDAENTLRGGFIQRESVKEGADLWQQRDFGTRDSERIHSEEGAHASNTSIKRQQGQGEQSIGGQEGFIERSVLQWNFTDASIERRGRWDQRSEADHGAQRAMDQDERQHWDGVRCEVEGCGADAANRSNTRTEGLRPRWKDEIHRSESASDTKGNGDRGGLRQVEGSNGVFWQSKERREDNNESWNDGEKRDASNAQNIGRGRSASQRGEDEQHGVLQGKQAWSQVGRETQGCGGEWNEFPTQSPVCGRDDGFSSGLDGITFPRWRRESIKAYGNAIVPQIAYRIFKAIEATL